MFLPVLAAGLASGLFSFVATWYNNNSELAKERDNLRWELKTKNVTIEAKDETIRDLEIRVAELKGDLRAKDLAEHAIKNQLELYRVSLCESKGVYFTNQNDLVNYVGKLISNSMKGSCSAQTDPRLAGTVAQRLGLKDEWTFREKIEKGWNRELFVGSLPGVFLPAPSDMCSAYLSMLDAAETNDLKQVAALARELHKKISLQIDPYVCRGAAMVDTRYGIVASFVYAMVAEDEFAKGNYTRALYLMGTAAGILGPRPPPHLLAKESAIAYKAGGCKTGFFTQHMADAIQAAKDDDYRFEIFAECAKLGYLQLYMPSADGKDVGKKIDWAQFDTKRRPLPLRKVEERNGELWSTRWCGLGKFEEYNVSAELRRQYAVRRELMNGK